MAQRPARRPGWCQVAERLAWSAVDASGWISTSWAAQLLEGLGALDKHLNRPVRSRRSQLPPGGGAHVGHVGAVRTGADGAAEMLAKSGVVAGDPRDRLADGSGHTGTSVLRMRTPLVDRGRSGPRRGRAPRTRKSRSASAWAARSPSPIAQASSMSSSISARRRRARSWLACQASRPRRPTLIAAGQPRHRCLRVRRCRSRQRRGPARGIRGPCRRGAVAHVPSGASARVPPSEWMTTLARGRHCWQA